MTACSIGPPPMPIWLRRRAFSAYASVRLPPWPHSNPREPIVAGTAIAIKQSEWRRVSVRSDRLQETNDVIGEQGTVDHRPEPDGRFDACQGSRELRRVALSPRACLRRDDRHVGDGICAQQTAERSSDQSGERRLQYPRPRFGLWLRLA